MKLLINTILSLALLLAFHPAWSQPKLEFDIRKPDSFAHRQLGSEKFANKKFTIIRRAFQNTYTRYNYHFNANEKVKQILQYATDYHEDDYTKLLSFKPYDLAITARSGDIDSILNTTTAGILLHDLRNDWVDDLYLLMGKAYFLRQDFDSAYMVFQYLNYTFAPKQEGGYSIPIGSNASESGNGLSIASSEDAGLVKKAFLGPPSRNEALVWMVNTYLEAGEIWEAAALISTLRNDPTFPERLRSDLLRSNAHFHYLNNQWDSAAFNLETALNLGDLKGTAAARDWYLAGQLYNLAGKPDWAADAFQKSIQTTIDPVMDVYARLNIIRLKKAENPEIIDQSIADLIDMARKDRFYRYRDIIYYAAGLFEMERNGYAKADEYFQQSIKYNENNAEQRSQSFLMMADARYEGELYGMAYMPYDSVNLAGLTRADSLRIAWRKPATQTIYYADKARFLQDSLMEVAAMPEAQRIEYVRGLSRRMRRDLGIKDDIENAGMAGIMGGINQANDQLFASTAGRTFYFADPGLRANGYNTFRQQWGERPNQDNWRRSSAISPANARQTIENLEAPITGTQPAMGFEMDGWDSTDVSFDNLYSRLPISEASLAQARLRAASALLSKGKVLQNHVENYPLAIRVYDSVFMYIDSGEVAAEALHGMIYTYEKLGDTEGANQARALLKSNFPQSAFARRADKPQPPAELPADGDPAITQQYKNAYNLFIDGSFDEALSLKRRLDSTNGSSYWTPQLVYIETVHQLQEKQDSLAMQNLDYMIAQYPQHPIAEKAKIIKEFLPRRREIEDYLTKLEITRAEEDRIMVVSDTRINTRTAAIDPALRTAAPPVTQAPRVIVDTSARVLVAVEPPVREESPYRVNPDGPQVVALLLENMDPAYVNEVHYSLNNSPRRNNYRYSVTAEKKRIADKLWLVLLRSNSFTNATNAYEYIEYLRPVAEENMLSWLDASRYKYIILPEEMLNFISNPEQMKEYEKVLQSTFPGKF